MTAQRLGGGRMKLADFAIPRHVVIVPAGTKMADVVQPQYFQNYFDKFQVNMELTILSEDNALDARVRVMSFDRLKASLRVLDVYCAPDVDDADGIEETPAEPIDGLYIKWGGPNAKFRVVDNNNEVIESGFATKEAAEDRLKALQSGE